MDMIAIGNRIKAAREQAHLTQEERTEIVNFPAHMSVIERDVKTPKLDTFVRIVNAMNTSPDALLQDVAEPANESISEKGDDVVFARITKLEINIPTTSL